MTGRRATIAIAVAGKASKYEDCPLAHSTKRTKDTSMEAGREVLILN
jgi:hypothetical protein